MRDKKIKRTEKAKMVECQNANGEIVQMRGFDIARIQQCENAKVRECDSERLREFDNARMPKCKMAKV